MYEKLDSAERFFQHQVFLVLCIFLILCEVLTEHELFASVWLMVNLFSDLFKNTFNNSFALSLTVGM